MQAHSIQTKNINETTIKKKTKIDEPSQLLLNEEIWTWITFRARVLYLKKGRKSEKAISRMMRYRSLCFYSFELSFSIAMAKTMLEIQ